MGVRNGWVDDGDDPVGNLWDMGKCRLTNHELPSPRLDTDSVASNDFDLLPVEAYKFLITKTEVNK